MGVSTHKPFNKLGAVAPYRDQVGYKVLLVVGERKALQDHIVTKSRCEKFERVSTVPAVLVDACLEKRHQ